MNLQAVCSALCWRELEVIKPSIKPLIKHNVVYFCSGTIEYNVQGNLISDWLLEGCWKTSVIE